ncbi:hypothetical protein V6N12_014701 [Hibiscus sabdariffa]|uniref:Uncharacterized protein n=1 Tax=Hibiscus sabdariffa TaxID=183260 RepID=A0ABR2DKZ3_9ROSI
MAQWMLLLIQRLVVVLFVMIPVLREGNYLGDCMAKNTLGSDLFCYRYLSSPEWCIDQLHVDPDEVLTP